jgi:hypothetical protein
MSEALRMFIAPLLAGTGAVIGILFVPLRWRWVGYPLGIVAGLAKGMITRPPRSEWAHLHGFESSYWQHALPAVAGFVLAYLAADRLARKQVSTFIVAPATGAVYLSAEIATAVAMLIGL